LVYESQNSLGTTLFWTHLRKCCKSWQSCCSRESFGRSKGNRRTRTREGESFGIRKETEEQEQEKETIEVKNNDSKRASINPKAQNGERRCRSSRKKNPKNKTLSCKP
jgi:hypothetical protein